MSKKIHAKNIKLDKRKGQHILKDKHVIKRQIEYAELSGNEVVLEIGAGLGALTFELANKAKKVIAVEKDRKLFSYLEERIPENVELINDDVMEIKLPKFDVVVANLPYQISSPVSFKLLESQFDRGILMYQKEFAERMVASAGDSGYSRLSVNIYYRADCKILEYVPKEAFNPVPEVDSAVVRLIPRDPPFSVKNEKIFFEVIEALFGQRRKKIKNSLEGLVKRRIKPQNKGQIRDFLENLPSAEDRVDSLNPKEIGVLSDEVVKFTLKTSR
jgi:16S rRNA (adenine1518-N6/adenine1519-N6)-dimethyltransferase